MRGLYVKFIEAFQHQNAFVLYNYTNRVLAASYRNFRFHCMHMRSCRHVQSRLALPVICTYHSFLQLAVSVCPCYQGYRSFVIKHGTRFQSLQLCFASNKDIKNLKLFRSVDEVLVCLKLLSAVVTSYKTNVLFCFISFVYTLERRQRNC